MGEGGPKSHWREEGEIEEDSLKYSVGSYLHFHPREEDSSVAQGISMGNQWSSDICGGGKLFGEWNWKIDNKIQVVVR